MVICGGVHTLGLSKKGHVYSWGRGEGGQLGHAFEDLEKPSDFEIFLTKPRKIAYFLNKGIIVTKIACGDAHS